MPTGSGVKAKCGISIPASWGASWAAVDTPIPFSSESIEETIEMLEDLALEGQAGKRGPDAGLIKLAGALNGQLDYNNWGLLIRAGMGAESGGVYSFENDLTRLLRIEFEKSVSRWRIDSFMVEGFTITGEKGGLLTAAFDLVCRSLSRSATAFPSLTISNRNKIRFSNSTSNSYFRIANLDDALASGDKTGIEKFTLAVKNNLVADDATNEQRTVLQPIRNGYREVSLDIGIPRYEADTFQTYKAAHTPLQADLYFTDGTYSMLFELPELYIASGFNANVAGPGKIAQEGKLAACRNINNSNMPAIDDELRITVA